MSKEQFNDWFPHQLGYDIWNKKYRYNNESLDEWFDRISNDDKELKKLIKEKKFLFAGRILANRGLQEYGKKITYSNCYVLEPPKDNLESIFQTASELARTYSYGGGCGIDISKLAPQGAKVNNAAEHSSGAVSFMDLFSLVTELISQNGRRGALMISINDTHPDLELFINIKNDLSKITKANISVRLSDAFMIAVEDDREWELYFDRKETGERINKIVNAREIFMKLVENNWNYAEPGILFWDRITGWHLNSNNSNLEYAGVNPCSEKPLTAGGSCLLGSINLSEYVLYPFTDEAKFNWNDFARDIRIYVDALNNILHEGLDLHPLQIQRDNVNKWRQIGLGVMGLHDLFIKLNIIYGSQKSLELSERISKILVKESLISSAFNADIYGEYPSYQKYSVLDSSFLGQFIDDNEVFDIIGEKGLANAEILSIAPTGSISTMLGISGGIEPIFAHTYSRKTESLHGEDTYYTVNTPIVDEYFKITGNTELNKTFITTEEIDYNERINMQAVWQLKIDSAISSTINLPEETTVEQVYDIYMKAWKQGLKGLTIFRSGCKRTGILTTEIHNSQIEKLERPEKIPCDIHNVKIDGSEWTIIIGILNSIPYELFAFKNRNINIFNVSNASLIKKKDDEGKNHYSITSDNLDIIDLPELYKTGEEEFITRLITRLLRFGEIDTIIKDGEKTYKNIGTFVNVIIRVLKKYVTTKEIDEVCPECGNKLIMTEGCVKCSSCSYSKCG